MKRYLLLLAMVLAGGTWARGDGSAQQASSRPPVQEVAQEEPPAYVEPGYKWVRATRYREDQYPVCKRVPNKIYRWVYATRPDYYCIPPCPIHLFRHKDDCDGCETCQSCKGPYYRPQLKKMQIEINSGWKCVVEYIKYKVPYVVWRKVRIGSKEDEEGKSPETLPQPKPVPPTPPKPPKGEPDLVVIPPG